MKKIVIYLSMILMIFLLVGCNQNNKPTDIKLDIGESTKFSKEEIDNAVDCLKRNFDFEACTLTKIYYNEEISNTAVENYLQFGNGSVNKVKAENVIVLLSERKTDKALLVKQHEEMLSIIKNKDLDKIDEYIEKHIVAPAKEWSKLINDNEEIRRYLK